MLQDF